VDVGQCAGGGVKRGSTIEIVRISGRVAREHLLASITPHHHHSYPLEAHRVGNPPCLRPWTTMQFGVGESWLERFVASSPPELEVPIPGDRGGVSYAGPGSRSGQRRPIAAL